MKKYKYIINNLDCANCARTLEETLNKNKDLKNVIVNFSTKTISFDSDNITLEQLNTYIKKIEPNAFASLKEENKKEYYLSVLIIGVILGIIGLYVKMPWYFNEIFIILSYALLLYKTFINSIKLLIKSKTINENALITISCIGAYLVNQKMEGIMVVTLYLIGKILEAKAINNTRNSIKELMDIKQDYANKKTGSSYEKIDVSEVLVGDTLLVKKGEKVPVDGIVLKGTTTFDMKALTGEEESVIINEKDKVLSGSINLDNNIIIKAKSIYNDSTVYKIINLIEEATDKKAKTETIVSRISKYYTPIILLFAILTAFILPLFNISFEESIYRALTFLVISCPCAIAISVPLSYFTGIGTSSKYGILIKGSNYLDNLSNIKNIIFDKTGTLTTGTFTVSNIIISDKNYTKEKVIDILVAGESFSNHPIAKSIIKLTNKKIDQSKVNNFKESVGIGLSYEIGKDKILVVSGKKCNCSDNSDIHLNINGKHIATIIIDDGIKKEANIVINELKKNNIKTFMFTGDKKSLGEEVAKRIGIDTAKTEMLPEDKYKEYERICQTGITSFVGDGINDAPVLKRSDIGISMGQVGQQQAIEASDVVIMKDDLRKIPQAIKISKYTNRIIKQNLIFALSTKIIILILSIFGLTTMWMAVFADTGVTLLTILNTIRIRIKKY